MGSKIGFLYYLLIPLLHYHFCNRNKLLLHGTINQFYCLTKIMYDSYIQKPHNRAWTPNQHEKVGQRLVRHWLSDEGIVVSSEAESRSKYSK